MFSQLKIKISKIGSVLKVKETYFAKQWAYLLQLKEAKVLTAKQLSDQQKAYLNGVAKLNQLRSQATRDGLEFYESNVDMVKQMWISLHRRYQQIDKETNLQNQLVLQLKQQIDGIEKIKVRLEQELLNFIARKEQEHLDELSQRKTYLEQKKNLS